MYNGYLWNPIHAQVDSTLSMAIHGLDHILWSNASEDAVVDDRGTNAGS